jgi:hypothetical protein
MNWAIIAAVCLFVRGGGRIVWSREWRGFESIETGKFNLHR